MKQGSSEAYDKKKNRRGGQNNNTARTNTHTAFRVVCSYGFALLKQMAERREGAGGGGVERQCINLEIGFKIQQSR